MSKTKKIIFHLIDIFITLFFIYLTLTTFKNSIIRIIEGVFDFGISCCYYFQYLIGYDLGIKVTVINYSSVPLVAPMGLPSTWNDFTVRFSNYWTKFANFDNFKNYWVFLADLLLIISRILLIIIPILFFILILFRRSFKSQNNDFNVDTKPLKVFKWILNKTYRPIKKQVFAFIEFNKSFKLYFGIWLVIWALNFNFITIILEFLAFYFYFVFSFDLLSLYVQVYKLFADLSVVINFIPIPIWIILVIIALDKISKSVGYDRLEHNELKNRGLINQFGVCLNISGVPGCGKTLTATSIALSQDIKYHDMALEIILESDFKFPNFPWIILENDLKEQFENHTIYDVYSCRRYIRNKCEIWTDDTSYSNIWQYDYDLFGLFYDNNLELQNVWQVIENYACAYFIYTVQTSFIISTYSVRIDSMLNDLGNFPLWNNDFFRRDSRLIDSFSRHSHILDFDMLRLGKKMIEDNPNKFAYGIGVYVCDEWDKERKNSITLKEVKSDVEICTQKNDLTEVLLKISRHGCVVDNKVFTCFIGTLQRPRDLGATVLEVGDVMYINNKLDFKPVLPFYSPYYLISKVFSFIYNPFRNLYLEYRFNRSDNTLLMYLFKKVFSVFYKYTTRIENLFGCSPMSVSLENGRLDGQTENHIYYIQSKKDLSGRYCTDCLSGIFESRAVLNDIGINDLETFNSILASDEELRKENSHFYNDIVKYKGSSVDEVKE